MLQINCPLPLKVNPKMEAFHARANAGEKIIQLECRIGKGEIPEDAEYIRTANDTRYFKTKEGELAVYYAPKTEIPLLWLFMDSGRERTLYISPEAGQKFYSVHELFKHIELIHLLMEQDIWVLHSCYVKTAQGAILFTGKSGIGKSTQGNLWEKSGCGEVINGDRSLIYCENGKYMVNGFIYSGSSGICKNHPSSIRAIVILNQSGKNEVKRVDASKAVRTLFLQLVSCPYRESENERKLDFAEKLFENVEVLQLNCRPDEDAVRVLQEYLQK